MGIFEHLKPSKKQCREIAEIIGIKKYRFKEAEIENSTERFVVSHRQGKYDEPRMSRYHYIDSDDDESEESVESEESEESEESGESESTTTNQSHQRMID